jgi:hypothetical protein
LGLPDILRSQVFFIINFVFPGKPQPFLQHIRLIELAARFDEIHRDLMKIFPSQLQTKPKEESVD